MTREELRDYVEEQISLNMIPYHVYSTLIDGIDTLEQEPRKGHWITKYGKEQGYDIGGVKTWYIQIMCSECGFIKTAIEGHTGQYNYCPQCGCKMQEVEE